MKFKRMEVIVLFLFFSITTWAQNVAAKNDWRHTVPIGSAEPVQVLLVPPPLTIFERDVAQIDQPFVTLNFPAVSADLGPRVSFNLMPLGLASFDAPAVLRTLAVEFHLSQSGPAARNTEAPQSHSVVTLLDFNELPAFRSLFNALAVTGMPQSAFSGAKPVVRMASRSGMRMEFTAEPGGRILLVVATEVDSVTVSLDADAARKCADAFVAAHRTLDAAKDSR